MNHIFQGNIPLHYHGFGFYKEISLSTMTSFITKYNKPNFRKLKASLLNSLEETYHTLIKLHENFLLVTNFFYPRERKGFGINLTSGMLIGKHTYLWVSMK